MPIQAPKLKPATQQARAEGINVGHVRLVVVWPFPERYFQELAEKIRAFVVPELNLGQVALVVDRAAHGRAPVTLVGHTGGTVHQPVDIYDAIRSSVKGV